MLSNFHSKPQPKSIKQGYSTGQLVFALPILGGVWFIDCNAVAHVNTVILPPQHPPLSHLSWTHKHTHPYWYYHRVHIFTRDETGLAYHSAGAYTATLLVMVNVVKGGGRAPPPSPVRANFTLMVECKPESGDCCYSVYSVYSVDITTSLRPCSLLWARHTTEPVFLNVYGVQASIPRNDFRQPM